jgi:hypothetical protein
MHHLTPMPSLARIVPPSSGSWGIARTVSVACALACAVACAAPGLDELDDPGIQPPPRGESTTGAKLPPSSTGDTESGGAGNGGGGAGDAGASKPPPDAAAPPSAGAWIAVNGEECVSFCASRGKTNVPSVEGASCTSGENIPQSALAAGITYNKCYPNCNAHLAGPNPKSDGSKCYADGQKKDGDSSDTTRGCFCK